MNAYESFLCLFLVIPSSISAVNMIAAASVACQKYGTCLDSSTCSVNVLRICEAAGAVVLT